MFNAYRVRTNLPQALDVARPLLGYRALQTQRGARFTFLAPEGVERCPAPKIAINSTKNPLSMFSLCLTDRSVLLNPDGTVTVQQGGRVWTEEHEDEAEEVEQDPPVPPAQREEEEESE